MEHQTLVMLNTGYIGGGHESTIAHELAHMWWGDMVTHVGYADVWLNEGFATYSESLWREHVAYRDALLDGLSEALVHRAGAELAVHRSRRRVIHCRHVCCHGAQFLTHGADRILGTVSVDNLFVTTGELFSDGFDDGDTNRWSSTVE